MDNSGSLTSEKAFNFGFYTKVVIGTSTINLKITQPDSANNPHLFELNPNDVDLMVESIYNRVETAGQSVDSGSAAGNFVKIDDLDDIAMGNGGDDTYVIDTAGNGTVLEYGDVNTTIGGLDNSENDSVNFANITSIDQLTISRGKENEDTDNTLLIGTAVAL